MQSRATWTIWARLLLAPAAAVGLAQTPAQPLQAQPAECDRALTQLASHPHGYRSRGDRCEGIYAQDVSGTPLLVASFTAAFDDYDLRSARTLPIRWATPAANAVRLRAVSLRRRLYYRMDATQPGTPSAYGWPTDLLAALDVPRADLGVVGWTKARVGATERDVHLPIEIGASRRAPGEASYTVVLVPGVQLSEVYVSVASVGSDGRPGRYLRDEEPLKYGYYPAERPIDVSIATPSQPGVYYVLIGATMSSGGALTAELWFFRP
jgi:hypothetical protein